MDGARLEQKQADREGPIFTRRELVIGGALGSAALVAQLITPRPDPGRLRGGTSLDKLVPKTIGQRTSANFEGVLIPQGEDTKDKSYDQVLTRYYTGGSVAPIMLLIAYGSAQVGNTELHRPQVCYPSAGFRLRSWPNVTLNFLGTISCARR